jgi:hypothetical protein
MSRTALPLFAALGLVGSAVAQNVSDPNHGLRMTHDASTGAYGFSWWGRSGESYFLQHSEDLVHWVYLPIVESGIDQSIQWGFTSSATQFFLRLEIDSDPFNHSASGDGFSNGWKILWGFDPHVWLDPVGDSDGDGQTDSGEMNSNTNPRLKDHPVVQLSATGFILP